MRHTITFLISKYLAEVALASFLLAVWPQPIGRAPFGFWDSFLGGMGIVFIGTVVTGYLVFLCLLILFFAFYSIELKKMIVAACSLSLLYVLVGFLLASKNDISNPIALGLLIVNASIALITLVREKSAARH